MLDCEWSFGVLDCVSGLYVGSVSSRVFACHRS